MPVNTISHPDKIIIRRKENMKGERTAIFVCILIAVQTSLAVEMDIFAGPFVQRRDQKIKNERPIIGTLT